jgi:Ser-tRNA(Ala) deacylase AlaX
MKGRTATHILELIENLEREIALLKTLVHQAISDDEIGQDILIDAEYLDDSDQDSILVDAEVVVEDTKPAAKKPISRKEARRRAKAWAAARAKELAKAQQDRH